MLKNGIFWWGRGGANTTEILQCLQPVPAVFVGSANDPVKEVENAVIGLSYKYVFGPISCNSVVIRMEVYITEH